MIKGIWKAYFTTPGTATFLTVEGRISMVNILPYSRLESAWLQLERKTREREREREREISTTMRMEVNQHSCKFERRGV